MKNIFIIGCGLLGSSLLRRIHKKKLVKKIFIYEKSKSNIRKIKKLRLPGLIVKTLEEGIINSDLIIVCTPMSEYKKLILKIIFLYSLIGVQKIINSDCGTASFNFLNKTLCNFNFFILSKLFFDLS